MAYDGVHVGCLGRPFCWVLQLDSRCESQRGVGSHAESIIDIEGLHHHRLVAIKDVFVNGIGQPAV